ncbi:hypothetical protein FBR02_03925 [Anaerolineae bacterium CFX9]|nr:hypothetical protein [Anaerolineae bacterium CFX9]
MKQGLAQIGIALGALGVVLSFMGFFPTVTGIEPGLGIGLVQFIVIYTGFILLTLGALIYVKFTLYEGRPSNLGQQVGVRLSMTGLLFTAIAGMADFLGFGSHALPEIPTFFGALQGLGVLGGFLIAALGVMIYAIAGSPPEDDPPPDKGE